MEITSINRYSRVSQYQRLMAEDLSLGKISKTGFLPEVEPVSAIVKQKNQIVDKNDIDYEKVKQYEEKIFGQKNQEKPTLSALPKEKENDFIQKLELANQQTTSANKTNEKVNNDKNKDNKKFINEEKSINGKELSEEQKNQIKELQKIDREVKAHEQAHLAAGAGLVRGGASYSYTQGPDGQKYATGGEVSIDMSAENTPAKTEAKMQQVIAAAMAPADPSPQDYAVAATASKIATQARIEKVRQAREDNENSDTLKIQNKPVNSNQEAEKKFAFDMDEEENTTNKNNLIQSNSNNFRTDGKLKTAYFSNQSNNNQIGRIANFVA